MKQIKLIMLFCIGVLIIASKSFGQANPFINVLPSNSGIVSVGATIDIVVTIGNTGPVSTVPQAKLRPLFDVPPSVTFLPNAQQTGLPAGWTILSNSGSQLRVCNSTDPIPVNATRTIILKVQGVTITPPQTFSGNINFGNGTNCGAGPSVNGDVTSDNSALSTIEVIPACNFVVTASASATTVCAGGSVTLNGGGATTYTWTNGVNTPTNGVSFVPASTSTYTVTGTTAGCSSTATLTVTVNPIPTVTASSIPSPATVCAGGSVTLNGGGATTYTWTNGVNAPTDGVSFVPASTSTYTVTGTSAGCSSTATLAVTVNPIPTITLQFLNNVACNGGSNGSISINIPTGGTAPYSYNWTPGNPIGDGTSAITGLTAGTYTVTVTDASSCVSTQSYFCTQPTAIVLNPLSQTNIACNGGSNGAASVQPASGGSGSFTYNWTPGNPIGDGTVSVTGLTAGVWTCTVTDANSCTAQQTFNITQPAAIVVTPASQTNISCFGGSNGAASINTPTGGAGGFTYNWTPGNPTGDGTVSVTGLTAGTWTCTVTDANSCTAQQTFNITQPTVIVVTPASQTNISCFGGSNGAASINTPTGGAGGYTYNWTPGNPTGDGTVSVTGLTAGVWTCTVTDANSCIAQQTFNITQPATIVVTPASQTNISCFGGSNGAASINTPTGGAGGYTYNWTPGNPTGDGTVSVTGLTAGTWTCTVTDANSCTSQQTFNITQPATIVVTPASQTNISCFGGSNGAASINTPTGGAGGFTYNWTPGNPTGDGTTSVTGLIVGTWTCTATDANGCTATQIFNITQPAALLVTASASQTSVCAGGSVTLNGGGATTYTWTDGVNTPTDGVSFIPVSSSTYTVTGTTSGCTSTATVAISVNPIPTVTATATPNNTVCAGSPVTLQGGGALTYTWNTLPTLGSDTTLTPAVAGTYTVVGTDANGCSSSSTLAITVNNLPTITANVTPGNTVTVNTNVTLFGGGAVSYVWNGPIPVSDNVSFAATLGASGTYTVVGTDANFCNASATVVLNVNPIPIPGFFVNSLIWGSSPFQDSLWSVDTTTWQVVNRIAPSLTGFTITGINGLAFDPCEFKTYAILKVSGVQGRVLATIDLPTGVCTQVGGFGTGGNFSSLTFRKDGQLFGTTGNGATAPYIAEALYLINKTNAATTLATALGNGADGEIICYNQSDDNFYHWSGNSTMVMEKFPANAPYTPITNITISGSSSGETFGALSLNPSTFIISNISSQFKYVSNTGVYGNSLISLPDDFRGLVMPPKFGTNRDSLCAKVDTITVASSGAQWFTTYYSWGDGTIDTVVGNGSATHKYLTPGTKTLNVLLWNGTCLVDTFWSKSILVKNTPTVTITGNNAYCLGDSVLLTGSSGGSSQWYFNGIAIPSANTNTYFASQVGWYNMIKTNINGCADSAALGKDIIANPAPLVTASATPTTTCNNSIVVPTGGGASTYVWNGGLTDGAPFVASIGATSYTVTGTDGAGCTATSSVTITGTAASGTLAPATSNQSQNQGDDLNASYYDPSCNLIATIDDGAGGNILGITIATVNVDANAGVYNGQPFVRRWYQITPSNNVGVSAMVTLYIDQADFTNYNSVVTAPYLPMPTSGNNADPNINNIRITKNADAGLGNSPLVIQPTTVNWNGTYWELTFPVTGFSQFRVHSVNPGNAALPATITNFSGRKMNNSDMLEWTTASEQNNAYFNLQHGTDGVNFTTIAKVNSQAANGNSSSILNYNFENTKPQLGHNYYRLQQVDIDNHSTMNAKVVDIIWGTNGSTVSIYPNPTQDVLNIDLYTSRVQNTTVKVLDMSGRIVKQVQARSEAGMNKLSLSLGDIASGVYTVQVFENDQLTHVSKVKKNE